MLAAPAATSLASYPCFEVPLRSTAWAYSWRSRSASPAAFYSDRSAAERLVAQYLCFATRSSMYRRLDASLLSEDIHQRELGIPWASFFAW